MREIKFRAWDKQMKKMRSSAYIGNLNIYHLENGATEIFDFMQYIGIRDKKDKEIYEGDIAKFGNQIGVIGEMQQGCFTFIRKEKYLKCDPLPFCAMNFEYVEVIGNVHENIGLLEWEESE